MDTSKLDLFEEKSLCLSNVQCYGQSRDQSNEKEQKKLNIKKFHKQNLSSSMNNQQTSKDRESKDFQIRIIQKKLHSKRFSMSSLGNQNSYEMLDIKNLQSEENKKDKLKLQKNFARNKELAKMTLISNSSDSLKTEKLDQVIQNSQKEPHQLIQRKSTLQNQVNAKNFYNSQAAKHEGKNDFITDNQEIKSELEEDQSIQLTQIKAKKKIKEKVPNFDPVAFQREVQISNQNCQNDKVAFSPKFKQQNKKDNKDNKDCLLNQSLDKNEVQTNLTQVSQESLIKIKRKEKNNSDFTFKPIDAPKNKLQQISQEDTNKQSKQTDNEEQHQSHEFKRKSTIKNTFLDKLKNYEIQTTYKEEDQSISIKRLNQRKESESFLPQINQSQEQQPIQSYQRHRPQSVDTLQVKRRFENKDQSFDSLTSKIQTFQKSPQLCKKTLNKQFEDIITQGVKKQQRQEKQRQTELNKMGNYVKRKFSGSIYAD